MKKIIKKIMMTLPIILWVSSCIDIPPKPNCDVSFQFDRCRCRCYKYDKFKGVDDFECDRKKLKKGDRPETYTLGAGKKKFKFHSGNYPIEVCEGISGAYLHHMAKTILPKAKENKQYCEDIK